MQNDHIQSALPYRQGNALHMRNAANHIRMPSLPSNIKGSIGNVAGGIHRDGGNGTMPLNIASNDISFAGDHRAKFMKFGPQGGAGSASNAGGAAAHGQRLMHLNISNPSGSPPGGGQLGYNFVVKGGN